MLSFISLKCIYVLIIHEQLYYHITLKQFYVAYYKYKNIESNEFFKIFVTISKQKVKIFRALNFLLSSEKYN